MGMLKTDIDAHEIKFIQQKNAEKCDKNLTDEGMQHGQANDKTQISNMKDLNGLI